MVPLDTLRLLLADVDPDRQVLTDDHLTGYLALNDIPDPQLEIDTTDRWRVRLAAADALDAIAVSEALVGKVIRTQDLTTDGVKVAAELRAQAAGHRARAAQERAETDEDDGDSIGVLEFHPWR
ncbi:hypothetical protein SAMN05216184_104105 [Georgenia satyanarayanai]|uniref:Uncharacterized protein n=1 Tax=Georgenia satyanarayanai TaxID=860221 RepID=A0A2Y9ACT8_9MICO|nr:hypothetical protein [Georgenia satyanarayanai]PYG00166.1 hypothetical protein A8987_104105 [Georgenia satyanarayanai]SSA40389.1 hypothetical protein SAMN05216184_104105 [Georgenia satyanarayanai]